MINMTWDYYDKDEEFILKEKKKVKKGILNSLSEKERKKLKKTFQAAEPTELFGQDFTRMGMIIDMMKSLDLIKDDNKLNKRINSMDERNLDIVATATKLRKEYETLFRQLREIVYPPKKGDKK
jgi:hypothetical protein|tara:strand:- start:485 stop:856 length:372 start_codon:yes stop_codon:yes gene_type:complete